VFLTPSSTSAGSIRNYQYPQSNQTNQIAIGPSIGSAAELAVPSACLIADSWWRRTTESVWTGLASRQAMMRFGAIIMLVALAAIWWRKT